MKRVLIVSQIIQQQFYDILKSALKTSGVEFDIITASKVDKVTIEAPDYKNSSLFSRFQSWICFLNFVYSWAKKNRGLKYNLIFVSSNPPINILEGIKLKKMFDAKLIFTHWDIYPQQIEVTLNNPFSKIIVKFWYAWNNRNYPKYDLMIANGNAEAEYIKKCTKSRINIKALPFAVDTDRLKPVPNQDNPFCKEHGLVGKFIILYSGNMGIHHNIELILGAASKLKRHKDIVFVFIGEGAKRKIVEKYVGENGNENVKLFPLQTQNVLPYSISCGDIGIVAQDAKGANIAYPSKAFSYMACGEALIAITAPMGDLYKLLMENEVGEVVDDNRIGTLCSAIMKLYRNNELLNKYKYNSRKYAEENLAIDVVSEKYKQVFSDYL